MPILTSLYQCVFVYVRVQLPQDRLQPIGSSYQYPVGMDVNKETYGCFGHLILRNTWCLAVAFYRITVYAQEVIFWLPMYWASYFHAACHCI